MYQQDWDNSTQNGTMVLPLGALEGCKAGLVDFQRLDRLGGPQRSEGRDPAVSSLVLPPLGREDWDNLILNGTMVLPMGALERCKTGLVDHGQDNSPVLGPVVPVLPDTLR